MGADGVKQLSLAKTTGQSLLSLVSGLGDIFAGLIIAISLGIFSSEPWIIALYPGVLSMRGVTGGLFSGRLSTSLHLGTIKTKFYGKNTKSLRLLWGSIAVLTFEGSILLGLVALLFGSVFWGITVLDGLVIFGTLIATMGLSLLVISPLTIAIAFSSFKKGLDPDIIVYPIMSTLADILVTVCYVVALSLSLSMGVTGQMVVLVTCIVFTCIVLAVAYKSRKEIEFTRTIKEAIYTMIIVAFIVNVTGSVLSRISKVVSSRPEIYVVYPALLTVIGDFGAIVGATATTKLALGTIDSSFKAIKNHRNQIAGAWIASVIIYVIIAFISSVYQLPIGFSVTLNFIVLLLATNVFAAAFMIWIAFSIAILTFNKGLDPDNFVIPIESSLADTITTISLLVMLSLIG
jgi:mgtE-like transporter